MARLAAGRWLAGLGLALTLPAWSGVAGRWSVELAVANLVYPGFALSGLTAALGDDGGELRIDRLTLGGISLDGVRLACPGLYWRAEALHCRDGSLRAPAPLDGAQVAFALRADGKGGHFALALAEGGGRLVATLAPDGGLQGRVEALPLGQLASWVPAAASWAPTGLLDCAGQWDGDRIGELSCTLAEGGFAGIDGFQAGEQLAITLDLRVESSGGGWHWRSALDWHGGALYIHPVYLAAGASLRAGGILVGNRLILEDAVLGLEGMGTLRARGELALDAPEEVTAEIEFTELALAQFGPRILMPLLLPAQADRVAFSGQLAARLQLAAGRPEALQVILDEVGLWHAGADGEVGPVSGVLDWNAAAGGALELAIDGGRWRRLKFGASVLDAYIRGDRIELDPVTIPVLDGGLRLEQLALYRGPDGWYGEGRAAIEPIAMPALTAALEWPEMGGALAASFPRVAIRADEIAVDGVVSIDVFAGRVDITDLHLIEPFGVGAYARAEMTGQGIDLDLLTRAFDFGGISGRIDFRVGGLELAGWRPVRFDARIESSPGRYRRRISQRAVQNLGALGGPGVVNAIQRSALRFFESFGYRRLGWGCRLESGVCDMDGIEPGAVRADGGFLIIEGRGVPALDVVGYNRRVAWDVLLTRLQRVIDTGPASALPE